MNKYDKANKGVCDLKSDIHLIQSCDTNIKATH